MPGGVAGEPESTTRAPYADLGFRGARSLRRARPGLFPRTLGSGVADRMGCPRMAGISPELVEVRVLRASGQAADGRAAEAPGLRGAPPGFVRRDPRPRRAAVRLRRWDRASFPHHEGDLTGRRAALAAPGGGTTRGRVVPPEERARASIPPRTSRTTEIRPEFRGEGPREQKIGALRNLKASPLSYRPWLGCLASDFAALASCPPGRGHR